MRIRWRNFELPSRVQFDNDTLTQTYGRCVVEPFERGFGHTIGNGLRRVLLSSIEGTAVTAVKIEGVNHEFDSLEGVYEDVADIILAIKRLRIIYDGSQPITLRIQKSGKGPVTGADVQCEGGARVANTDLVIATLTKDRKFNAELVVQRGRGYVPADENASEAQQLGTIPVDSIYSPVQRVRYMIEQTRVGKLTNYDRLVMEIWTDGTVSPEMALVEAAKIIRKHLNPFVGYAKPGPAVSLPAAASLFAVEAPLESRLGMLVADLRLSVRAANCLHEAGIENLRDLVARSREELAEVRNMGDVSVQEIEEKLRELGLQLGMQLPAGAGA
jgi:DNA-directed RNA polymerase subunit alpha